MSGFSSGTYNTGLLKYFPCFLFSLARMSLDQRLCPGVGGRICGAFMSPLFRDLNPTCVRCRGKKFTSDVTCDICKDWLVVQWEAFLKKRSYSRHRKSRPSGSALPLGHHPFPPLLLLLRKLGAVSLLHFLPPFLQRGVGVRKSRRVSPTLALVVPPLPPLALRQERERGGGVWLLGASVTWLLPPSWGRGSWALLLSGVNCAPLLCPSLGRLLCLG